MNQPNATAKCSFLALVVFFLGVNGGVERPASMRANPASVVFVHGYGDSGRSFAFFESSLRQRRYDCFAPDLSPADADEGIEDLAMKLKAEIDGRYGKDPAISIVAFSMGGLVARYYLQKLDGAARCRAFFTVSTPHHGTAAAYLADGKGAVQMRPGSAFLRELNREARVYRGLDPVSYWTPLDLMIFPAVSSIWRAADNVMVWELCHPQMLVSAEVIGDIIKRLDRAAYAGAGR